MEDLCLRTRSFFHLTFSSVLCSSEVAYQLKAEGTTRRKTNNNVFETPKVNGTVSFELKVENKKSLPTDVIEVQLLQVNTTTHQIESTFGPFNLRVKAGRKDAPQCNATINVTDKTITIIDQNNPARFVSLLLVPNQVPALNAPITHLQPNENVENLGLMASPPVSADGSQSHVHQEPLSDAGVSMADNGRIEPLPPVPVTPNEGINFGVTNLELGTPVLSPMININGEPLDPVISSPTQDSEHNPILPDNRNAKRIRTNDMTDCVTTTMASVYLHEYARPTDPSQTPPTPCILASPQNPSLPLTPDFLAHCTSVEGNGAVGTVKLFKETTAQGQLAQTPTTLSPAIVNALQRQHGSTAARLVCNEQFFQALRDQNVEEMERLVDAGADINYTKQGVAVIVWAAQFGWAQSVRKLLQLGARVHVPGGEHPLFHAVFHEHVDVIRAFIDCRINSEPHQIPLIFACASGKLRSVQLLIQLGANVNTMEPDTGATAVARAAASGHRAVVEILCQHNADVRLALPGGATPICGAAACGQSNVLDVLVAHGAEVDHQHTNYPPPLFSAAKRGYIEVAQKLVALGANVNLVGRNELNGSTALMVAVTYEQLSTAEALIHLGANVNYTNPRGRTPMFFAAESGQTEMVQLLAHYGAIVNQVDKDGVTPLVAALSKGYNDTAHVLASLACIPF